MLPLDSHEWAQLEHAYGPAIDTPGLISQLAGDPRPSGKADSEPWFSLWSSLCHQDEVYPASYAAVPHVVDICASYDGAVDFSFFLLPTCIEIARSLGRGPDLTDAFARDYYDAIERLRDCVIARISDDWDETFAMSLVAALAASKGQIRVANAIINLDGDLMDRIIEGDF